MPYQYGPEVTSEAVRERHKDAKVGGWIGWQGRFSQEDSRCMFVVTTFSWGHFYGLILGAEDCYTSDIAVL